MANYCFGSAEDRRKLFTEACVRGWLAGVLDFPHHNKSREECAAPALQESERLRSEVCCIENGGILYRALVTSAWVAAYVAAKDTTERFLVQSVLLYKRLPYDEALELLREMIVGSDEAIEVVDEAYAQFLAATE